MALDPLPRSRVTWLRCVYTYHTEVLMPGNLFSFPGVLATARDGPIDSTGAKELSIWDLI